MSRLKKIKAQWDKGFVPYTADLNLIVNTWIKKYGQAGNGQDVTTYAMLTDLIGC